MKNIIFSSISFLLIGMSYIVWKVKLNETKVGNLVKDFIDVSPAFLSFYFYGNKAVIFLMMCLIANEFIYDNIFIGAGMFAIGYVLSSIFTVSFPLDFGKVAISAVSTMSVVFPLLCVYKGDLKLKIGAGVYGSITLPFLFYAFYTTWNPGFLSLIIGDTLLLIGEMFPSNKAVRIVSDLFYFFGTCFVPLSLIGG